MQLLNAIRTGDYLPDRVTNLILQYLTNRLEASNQLIQMMISVMMRSCNHRLMRWIRSFYLLKVSKVCKHLIWPGSRTSCRLLISDIRRLLMA